MLQRWVRPAPKGAHAQRAWQAAPEASSSSSSLAGDVGAGGLLPLQREGSLGEAGVMNSRARGIDTHLAVPVRDFLEEEAPIEGALLMRHSDEGGRRHHRRRMR